MQFAPQENVLYKIQTALKDQMVLDISQNDKGKAIIYEWKNVPNQKFAIRSVGAGKFAIFCAAGNQTLEVPKGSTKNGEQIIASQPNKQANEFWEFIPCTEKKFAGKNAYYIRSYCGKALDVCQGKAKKDQAVIQWDYNGQDNQVWLVEPLFN